MKKKTIGLILLMVILILGACGDQTSEEDSGDEGEPLKINTTVYPLQYFTERIAGDAAEVETILPPGSDAHSYEPSTKEMVEMAEADAFIYNGAGLETYAEKISESIDSEDVEIVEASNGIDLSAGSHDHEAEDDHEEEEHAGEEDDHAHEEEEHTDAEEHDEDSHEGEDAHDHEGEDPHIWLDPVRSIEIAENIKETLVELQPESEEQFEENFSELEEDLNALDDDFHEQVEEQEKKEIIVSHAAYGYWEEAYGIEQIAVSGLSPSNEPSQKDLEDIIAVAEEHDIDHVLFEQNITPKVSEVVQGEIGADPLRVHNLSVLTEEDIENDEDYFTLMEQNLEVLNEALEE
ncbi:metal ABC transporter solute-binding protein, Zn/Mn family [Halobacillus sp. A5]|uniref:metal ABC transporter solute-binding protein, Zn/Mn family n=1 Tax=Halobacillus sp. A5 TaxID=2880263 RepID=UPI0020A620C8|nr:zinc ABC transporter substrate-binding protein [Halobacillus sp. A5]MCP3029062.1 zinc ABC transporter substrate-binding protein [Halobacillus sp. A5]